MKKIEILLLTLSTIFLISSCGSTTTYRPPIAAHDYKNMELVLKDHSRVYAGDKKFNEYASIHLDDLIKIAIIIKNAKLPKHIILIVEQYEKEVLKLKQKSK